MKEDRTMTPSQMEAARKMREALAPLARLQIPKRPQGNAGAYSIFHHDIEAARAALSAASAAGIDGE